MMKVTGIDLGDKNHAVCELDGEGTVIREWFLDNDAAAIRQGFGSRERMQVVMEAGTHSGWVSRLFVELGHEVLVANPRRLRAIWDRTDKSDRSDAELLARIGRCDPSLLHPIQHRGAEAQADLTVLRSRAALVETRTELVNTARSLVKSQGARLPSCSARTFAKKVRETVPENLRAALYPLLNTIECVSEQIGELDGEISALVRHYPAAQSFLQVHGVGELTAMAYILTLERADRFEKSRTVGAFLGLTPRRDQSGDQDKQLPTTRCGDRYLRSLLVQCANYIMGPFGQPSDLRRFGERIAARGGKNGRKRALVAVARKLAVLLHALWKNQSDYIPVRQVA